MTSDFDFIERLKEEQKIIKCDFCERELARPTETSSGGGVSKEALLSHLEPFRKMGIEFMWFCDDCVWRIPDIIEHERALDEEQEEKKKEN
jgi:hypothetical protein